MSDTMNPIARKLRSDRCEEHWPCNTEFCACNAMDEGADEIDRLCAALDEMQNMLRESDIQLAHLRAQRDKAMAALREIEEWPSSQPAALNMPDDRWPGYQVQIIRSFARHVLAELEAEKGGQDDAKDSE